MNIIFGFCPAKGGTKTKDSDLFMNKKILLLILFCVIFLPVLTYAALDFSQPSGNIGNVQNIVTKILNPVWEVFVGFAVIMFVFAGILFLSSSGEPEKIKTARNAVLWGVVGIVVGILAFSIMTIIKTAIGG
jgi:uncharacterized BrkB/YihY/UPF0761 family membrane protein